jgi:histidine triad (HIT) family protein
MTETSDCVFCKIVSGDIPCFKVFEDEHSLAFLDIGPLAEGHVLLIPKRHFETLDAMPRQLAENVAGNLPLLSAAVTEIAGAEGCNVLQNNGAVAGQVVPHVHFHIIPRRSGDGLGYRWNAGTYPPGRAEEMHAKLQQELAGKA